MSTPNQDDFKMSRIPLRPLPYSQNKLAQTRELLIDYDGENPTYNIYIVDPSDKSKIINITNKIITEAFPSINADNLNITIDGILNSLKLKDVINDIYKNFLMPEDNTGFVYSEDAAKLTDPNTINILLSDKGGTVYLPVTTASNVYDSTGKSMEDRLNSLTRIGFSTTSVEATISNQTSFSFLYPFKNYTLQGNFMEVRIGTVFVSKDRYEITDTTDQDGNIIGGVIRFTEDYIEIHRCVNLLFIYNAAATSGGSFECITGGNIANWSIPSTKLEKLSDRYELDDGTSIASSRALFKLYNELSNSISNWSPNCIYTVDTNNSASSGSTIMININSSTFVLKDCCKVNIRMINNSEPGAKVQINGVQYPIYDGNDPISISVPAGNIMSLVYSEIEKRFYMHSLYDYKLTTNRWVYTASDQETTISFNGLYYNHDDQIFVYKNGVRLFEYADYTVNFGTETITLYERTEDGDKFIFESFNVERR